MCAQTADLVPADKAMYALRDVTATVDDIALIASSVMSKKLAGGADAILLDVKTGSGAFMKDLDAARELAELCVALGEDSGRATGALITDMSQPLADAVGNASEVREAIEVLRGERHRPLRRPLRSRSPATWPRWPALADGRRARRPSWRARRSRAARRSSASGASSRPRAASRGSSTIRRCCRARRSATRSAPGATAGFEAVDAEAVGRAAAGVGAGRQRKEDRIDLGVGIDFLVRVGDDVDGDRVVAHVLAGDEATAERAGREVLDALTWSDSPVDAPPLVHDVIGARLGRS